MKHTSIKFQKGTSLNTAKLDQETEELSHKKVNFALRILKTRQCKFYRLI